MSNGNGGSSWLPDWAVKGLTGLGGIAFTTMQVSAPQTVAYKASVAVLGVLALLGFYQVHQ